MSAKDDLKNFNHVDLLFPSKYVKAADLRGKAVPVVIERIVPREELMMAGGKSDTKPVIFLRGKDKGWILNKTNARAIAKVYGPELTNWLGKTVVIISAQVEARGEIVDAIRVDGAATAKLARANGSASAPEREPGDDFVDEQALADAAAQAERGEWRGRGHEVTGRQDVRRLSMAPQVRGPVSVQADEHDV